MRSGVSDATPRLYLVERSWLTTAKMHRDGDSRKQLSKHHNDKSMAPATHLAILAVPRLSGADGGESPTSDRSCRSTPKRELPVGKMTKAST